MPFSQVRKSNSFFLGGGRAAGRLPAVPARYQVSPRFRRLPAPARGAPAEHPRGLRRLARRGGSPKSPRTSRCETLPGAGGGGRPRLPHFGPAALFRGAVFFLCWLGLCRAPAHPAGAGGVLSKSAPRPLNGPGRARASGSGAGVFLRSARGHEGFRGLDRGQGQHFAARQHGGQEEVFLVRVQQGAFGAEAAQRGDAEPG